MITMVTESDWTGMVAGRREDQHEHRIQTVTIGRAPQGGSRPAQVLADDGNLYWIKPIGNPQGSRVPTTEQVVGRCGALINAPTCGVSLLEIPAELAGYSLPGNHKLETGITHGSRDVDSAEFLRVLKHDERDDNATRRAYIHAMYDWCWGGDDQWLYCIKNDMQVFSHDHGHYLPGGPKWTAEGLKHCVDEAHPFRGPPDSVAHDAFQEAARRLEAVSRDQIAEILRKIPRSWPIGDHELETLGFFLDRRRGSVSERLRQMDARA